MNVLIEAIGIDKHGGGRTATLNLLEHIFLIDRKNSYTVMLSRYENLFDKFTNVCQVISPVQNRFLSRIWAQLIIPIRFSNVDVIHFTKNLSVFGLKTPHIITIHDLTTLVFPEFFPWTDVVYWKTLERCAVRAADLIIAVSKNTSDDVVKFYGKDPDKIKIIYHGKSRIFTPLASEQINRVLSKYQLPEQYIITVGRIDLKKNLTNLVRAFAQIQNDIDPGIALILVGEVYKKCEDVQLLPTIKKLGLQEKVIFLGRVPDEDLPALYSGAIVCAFPSLHEGFGLVGLEAMSCGVPVITHNNSAIVEVIGSAGLTIDARKVDELASALAQVINNPFLQQKMRSAGLEKVKEFDWVKAAELTINAYHQVSRK